MITSRHSRQNGFVTKNQAAQVSIDSSIQKTVPIFPLVITSLIYGDQQWYTQFPKIITSLLTIFSSRVKNLLHSQHPQTTHYFETCLTTNLVFSVPCLSIIFKQKTPIHLQPLSSISTSHLKLFTYFTLRPPAFQQHLMQ